MSYLYYGYTDVGGTYSLLPAEYFPNAVNSAGAVAGTVSGQTTTGTGDVGFFDLAGAIQIIAIPGAVTTEVTGLNDSDQIVGLYKDSSGVYHAFSENLSPACYCPGTLILTDRGEVPVEALALDDRVITGDLSSMPILWIGRRSYSARFLRGRSALLPVRIRAGALASGVPHTDLLVSPSHAMLLDEVLVPAGGLVNGKTIIREMGPDLVEYVHIELSRHAVIWANGAKSETFIDDESRAMFSNAAEYRALYGAVSTVELMFCAERVEHGYKLEAIRRRLAGIAELHAEAA